MAGYASLTDFIAYVKQNGFLHASHFHVIIGGSPGGELNSRDVMMLCESVNLPGLNIFTNELRVFGESRSTPYSVSYSEISMNFLLDKNMKVRQYFEDWTNQVFDRSTRELGYYTDYTKDIEIYVSDKEGKPVHAVKLYQCFPKSIGDVSLDYNSRDILRVPVTIQYKYWENMYAGNINNRRSTAFDLTGTGLRLPQSAISSSNQVFSSLAQTPLGLVGRPGTSLVSVGNSISNELPRLANASSAAAGASSLPVTISNNMRSLGEFSNNLGTGIASLGQSLAAFTAPVAAVSNAVGGISGTLNQFDSVLGSLGLGSPFSKTVSQLNGLSGSIAVISNANGIPGQIGSLGAVMTGAGGNFNQVARALDSVPEATTQFKDSLTRIGSAFSRRGTDLSNASSQLASEQEFQQ